MKIKQALDRVIAYIYQMDPYTRKEESVTEKISPVQIRSYEEGFRYKSCGGYPFLKKLIDYHAGIYKGSTDSIREYATCKTKEKMLEMFKALQRRGLIEYKLYRTTCCSPEDKVRTNFYVDLIVTEKGIEWVDAKDVS